APRGAVRRLEGDALVIRIVRNLLVAETNRAVRIFEEGNVSAQLRAVALLLERLDRPVPVLDRGMDSVGVMLLAVADDAEEADTAAKVLAWTHLPLLGQGSYVV